MVPVALIRYHPASRCHLAGNEPQPENLLPSCCQFAVSNHAFSFASMRNLPRENDFYLGAKSVLQTAALPLGYPAVILVPGLMSGPLPLIPWSLRSASCWQFSDWSEPKRLPGAAHRSEQRKNGAPVLPRRPKSQRQANGSSPERSAIWEMCAFHPKDFGHLFSAISQSSSCSSSSFVPGRFPGDRFKRTFCLLLSPFKAASTPNRLRSPKRGRKTTRKNEGKGKAKIRKFTRQNNRGIFDDASSTPAPEDADFGPVTGPCLAFGRGDLFHWLHESRQRL
jgi:hypothetical protein